MSLLSAVEVYQLRVFLRQISPMIWRRLLVRSDSTIADLHYTLQIAMGWDDFHLHQFTIRGKHYGVSYECGLIFEIMLKMFDRVIFSFAGTSDSSTSTTLVISGSMKSGLKKHYPWTQRRPIRFASGANEPPCWESTTKWGLPLGVT